jgi:hypothetical protein
MWLGYLLAVGGMAFLITLPSFYVFAKWSGGDLSSPLPLATFGGQYLLFMKFLPTTEDYEAFGDKSFELRNGMVFNLTRELLWDGQTGGGQDAAAVLADAQCCQGLKP